MSNHTKINIPDALKDYIEIEHCDDFNLNRYYLTEDLSVLFRQIKDLQRLTDDLRKKNIDYLNTTLLYGLSGTGKTTFARFIANQMDLDFAYINFAKVLGNFGETNRNISNVFRFMAQEKCVFMMDEIDCVTTNRSKDGGDIARQMSSITITVMQELDYYKKHKVESLVLAATNRVDILDEALLSRFAIKHEMKPLTNLEKEEYIMNYLEDVGVQYDEREIQLYCSQNSRIEQRNIESDMIQGIASWIRNGEKDFHLTHIK